jgi:hypothetical protein
MPFAVHFARACNFPAIYTLTTLKNVAKADLSADDFLFAVPAVVSVTTSGTGITAGSGDLNAGHVVTFTVTFDGTVSVNGGTPTLILNDGGVATLTGGSGSSVLTFQYTVANGQNTPDLAITGVNLHGATLHDTSGNDADLSGLVVNPAGTLQIDTHTPHLNNIAASPDSGVEFLGSTVHFTFNFDEAVHVTSGTPTLTLNDGGTAVYNAAATALLGDPSKLVFDYTVGAGEMSILPLAITGFSAHGAIVDDGAGNHADLANVTASFDGLIVRGIPGFPLPPPPPPPFDPPTRSMFGSSGMAEIHLDSPSTSPGLDLRELFAGSQEQPSHSPVAEHHTILDFHLV